MDISVIISILSLLVAAIVGFTNIRRNQSADNRQATAEMTTLLIKLETMSTQLSEIKADVRNQRADSQELRDKVIMVEASAKSAHHRLDMIEGKVKST